MSENMDASSEQLNSWKEIAEHLGRSVRTVHRWEQEEGLPVHRQKHEKGASVYAYRGELNAWLKLKSETRTLPQESPVSPQAHKTQVLESTVTTAESPEQKDGNISVVKPHTNVRWAWAAILLMITFLSLLWFLRHSHIEIRFNGAQRGGVASFQSPG